MGATVSGGSIIPGTLTGDLLVRVADPPTGAVLSERRVSLLNPPVLMSTLVVNAVPTRLSALVFTNRDADGPYSAVNRMGFWPSDTQHFPLVRIVGELLTGVRDDFFINEPNGGYNPTFRGDLAGPANAIQDSLVTPAMVPGRIMRDRPAIDVNRFVGPGVPQLPRMLIYRQQMVWAAWRNPIAASGPVADGLHVRTLVKLGTGFGFTTHQVLGTRSSRPPAEPYAGPRLILYSRVRIVPTALGATSLAADAVSTADAFVTVSVPGTSVDWTVRSGDITVPSGNPSSPPLGATVRAGATPGTFTLLASDTMYGNRQALAQVLVQAVRLSGLSASIPTGNQATVAVSAAPGGRVVGWTVDPAAAAAGVTVTPVTTGPGPVRSSVTVTRPAGFVGAVTVTATDSVVRAATAFTTIHFRAQSGLPLPRSHAAPAVSREAASQPSTSRM